MEPYISIYLHQHLYLHLYLNLGPCKRTLGLPLKEPFKRSPLSFEVEVDAHVPSSGRAKGRILTPGSAERAAARHGSSRRGYIARDIRVP